MILSKWKRLLNQMNMTALKIQLGKELDQTEKVIAVTWDFDEHGGESDIDIDLGYTTEEACLVTKVVAHELASVTGASSTYTLEFGSTAITGDIAVSSLATGTLALASSATAVAVAAGQPLQLNIGTADATAGKVRFYIYMIPQRDM